LSTSHDAEQLTMSRALLEDFKRYAARDRAKDIVELLSLDTEANSIAIKTIKETYGIED